jgi:hypothetical protein
VGLLVFPQEVYSIRKKKLNRKQDFQEETKMQQEKIMRIKLSMIS